MLPGAPAGTWQARHCCLAPNQLDGGPGGPQPAALLLLLRALTAASRRCIPCGRASPATMTAPPSRWCQKRMHSSPLPAALLPGR